MGKLAAIITSLLRSRQEVTDNLHEATGAFEYHETCVRHGKV